MLVVLTSGEVSGVPTRRMQSACEMQILDQGDKVVSASMMMNLSDILDAFIFNMSCRETCPLSKHHLGAKVWTILLLR